MNKKLMAVAVAGALAAPAVAFAQASNVTISGRLVLGIDSYEAKGATAANSDFKSRTRIYDPGSRLIIQGTEALGQGLTAYFYIESGFNGDNGSNTGQSGAVNANAGFVASRNSWVGLRGNWGALQFGRPNVFFTNGFTHFSNLGAAWAHTEPMLLTGIMGRGMSPGVAKPPNVVTYISPVLGGITTRVHYSTSAPGAGAAANQESQGYTAALGSLNTDAHLWSISMLGTWGAWSGGLDWVKGWSNTPQAVAPAVAAPQGTSNAWKGFMGYTYQPGGKVAALYLRSNQENGGSGLNTGPHTGVLTLGTDVSQNAWAVEWSHTWGNVQGMLTWAKANNISGCAVSASCDDTNATTWQIAARYLLSKRTWITAHYDKTSNAANYNLDYIAGGMSSGAIANGADPRMVGIGITHFF